MNGVGPQSLHRYDRACAGRCPDVRACVRAAWALRGVFFLQSGKEQPDDGRHVRRLGALLPTGPCAWLGFRVAELAPRFGCAAHRVQAAVRLALWPAVMQPQASDLDLRDATGLGLRRWPSCTKPLFKIGTKRIEVDVFDRHLPTVVTIVPAATTALADQPPIGGPVADSAKAPTLDKSLR